MKGDVINETGAIYASALLYGYEQKAFLVEEKEEAAGFKAVGTGVQFSIFCHHRSRSS